MNRVTEIWRVPSRVWLPAWLKWVAHWMTIVFCEYIVVKKKGNLTARSGKPITWAICMDNAPVRDLGGALGSVLLQPRDPLLCLELSFVAISSFAIVELGEKDVVSLSDTKPRNLEKMMSEPDDTVKNEHYQSKIEQCIPFTKKTGKTWTFTPGAWVRGSVYFMCCHCESNNRCLLFDKVIHICLKTGYL